MTDKQIIIDGKIKPITSEDVPTILELHKSKSFVEIAKMYGVTQNAIRYWVKKYNIKPLKQKDQIKILEEALKRKEQECEELKRELQAQRDFTAHEQKLIYCVAYDETCKTGNDCKQEKCIFKDNIKLKQTLAEIKKIVHKSVIGGTKQQILRKISECEENNDMENN